MNKFHCEAKGNNVDQRVYCYSITVGVNDSEAIKKYIRFLLNEIERLKYLIEQMLFYMKEILNIRKVLEQAFNLVKELQALKKIIEDKK